MILCGNCGREVESGQNFCPYCASQLSPPGSAEVAAEALGGAGAMEPSSRGRSRYLEEEDLAPADAAPLSSFDERRGETDKSQRKLFLVVGLVSAVVLAGLALLFTTEAGRSLLPSSGGAAQERLEGALRPGSPGFDEALGRLMVDFNADEDATTSPRPVGDIVISMKPTIRNFTGRAINGLELRATGRDIEGAVVKERNFVVIPTRQPELEPNKTFSPNLLLEGVTRSTMPASLRVEIVAVRFK